MFVPSIGGISHHWSENTADADIVTGAQVFTDTYRRQLAGYEHSGFIHRSLAFLTTDCSRDAGMG